MTAPHIFALVAAHRELQRAVDDASQRLRALAGVGSGPHGLTPDNIKAGPDYRAARAAYQAAFAALRRFNSALAPSTLRELAAVDRAARHGAE